MLYLIVDKDTKAVAACSSNEKQINYALRTWFDKPNYIKVEFDAARFGVNS